MRITRKLPAVVAACGALALAMSACSSGGGDDKPTSTAGGETTQAQSEAPATGDPVTFWGWAPSYPEIVDLWNETHPDKPVKFEQVAAGSKGGYDKMLTAVQAGNAPCLGQVGYETFTSFLAAGALEDVTSSLEAYKGDFPEWVWNQVGVSGKLFGVPVDTGPMAMFYRADKFEEAGIDLPTTWAEFKDAAEKVKAFDPNSRIYNFGNDAYNYSGFPWQAGAKWFGTEGDSWVVSVNSDENKTVGDYWQDLVDNDLVATHPAWDAALYSAWSEGTVWTEVGAVWTAGLLKSEAAASSGKWAVAPMPTWEGSDAVGNVGGSATAVLKGCSNVALATEFANWMSTDEGATSLLIDVGGMYPASTPGTKNAKLSQGDDFFGGQAFYDVFASESAKVNTDWQWGPTMTVTSSALADGLGKVGSGGGTMTQALDDTQAKTIAEIEAQGYSVKK